MVSTDTSRRIYKAIDIKSIIFITNDDESIHCTLVPLLFSVSNSDLVLRVPPLILPHPGLHPTFPCLFTLGSWMSLRSLSRLVRILRLNLKTVNRSLPCISSSQSLLLIFKYAQVFRLQTCMIHSFHVLDGNTRPFIYFERGRHDFPEKTRSSQLYLSLRMSLLMTLRMTLQFQATCVYT